MMVGALERQSENSLASLRSKGFFLKSQWILSLENSLDLLAKHPSPLQAGSLATPPPPSSLTYEEKLCEAFLLSDFALSATPSLPPGLCTVARGKLEGVHLLQVVEVVNLNEPRRHRNKLVGKNRFLKLVLTDGHQNICVVEYRPISCFSEHTLGSRAKFLIFNRPEIRRGIVFLQEGNVRLLWGGDRGEDDVGQKEEVACGQVRVSCHRVSADAIRVSLTI